MKMRQKYYHVGGVKHSLRLVNHGWVLHLKPYRNFRTILLRLLSLIFGIRL